jgi:cysteine desulfurase
MTDMTAYFDYNATAPVKPGVAAAMADALAIGGNPSSVHRNGRMAHAVIERARDQVSRLIGVEPHDIIFTSGGTEANNLALSTLARAGRRLIASAVEHPSVLGPAKRLKAQIAPVDGDGVVDLAELEKLLAADEAPAVVSIMFANNETGVVQPVAEAAEIAHRFGALAHCDAVQAPGRAALDMTALGVDFMSLSAHKMGGPMGCGALAAAAGGGGEISALFEGGGQERGLRPGTENVSGIAGFGVAAELALDDLARADEIRRSRDEMEARLTAAAPGARIIGDGAHRLNNTTCIAMAGVAKPGIAKAGIAKPGIDSETLVMALDLAGVAVSAGAACSSGKVTRSHVLAQMGVDARVADSAIRISLGWQTTPGDIERLIAAWTEIHGRLGSAEVALSAA